MTSVPQLLSHYYDRATGPFRNLSDLPRDQAEAMMASIRAAGTGFASKRAADYLAVRDELEARVRRLFIAKGGKPERLHPHSMILGRSDWLKSWYADGQELCIPLSAFAPESVSFTYGDLFPSMRYGDGKAYRGQVYVMSELEGLIQAYGLPQDCNPDGHLGPDRYIEAQVWDDPPLKAYSFNTTDKTMTSLTLRDATVDDAAVMTQLIVTAFEDHRGKITPPSSAHLETPEKVRTKLEQGGGFIAFVEQEAAGCVIYNPEGEGKLYLGRLAVLASFRQHGVGQALVKAVEHKAQAAGYAGVTLSVRIALPRNRAFFERLGYAVTGYERHAGYSEPTFMHMEKAV